VAAGHRTYEAMTLSSAAKFDFAAAEGCAIVA
jgi:hypothetical protein